MTSPRNIAVLLLFLLLLTKDNLQAAPLFLAPLRTRLARIYAPEIRQDRDEPYGLASVAYFLKHSSLVALNRRCLRTSGKRKRIVLGPATLLLTHDRIQTPDRSHICPALFDPFARSDSRYKGRKLYSAPNNLFLQLHNHSPQTLLRRPFHRTIRPTIHYHVYQSQRLRCLKRSWYGRCKRYEARPYYVIQFFFFLMYNDACNTHEGEHEGLVLVVDRLAFDRARGPKGYRAAIRWLGFYGHYKTRLLSPRQVRFRGAAHPIVYMGARGHASFPAPGSTDMRRGLSLEARRVISRVCRKRKKLPLLLEHHRGGGPIYQTWRRPRSLPKNSSLFASSQASSLPHQGDTPSPQSASSLPLPRSRPSSPKNRRISNRAASLPALPALQPRCLRHDSRGTVFLCDIQPNPSNHRCCFQQALRGYLRWVQFAGRWGKQMPYASGLTGATAARVGQMIKRWPLGRSLGNSGPFGPRFLYASTWNWDPLRFPAAATSPLWR